MPYNANIPQSTDLLSQSQADILANFQAIKTLIDVNHSTFGAATQGKHEKVVMPAQVAAPATTATEVALFSQTSALTGNTELAVRKQSSGASIEFTSSTAASPGWTRLPSGILIKWGNATMGVAGLWTLTLPVAASIPVFSHIFNVFVTTAYGLATDGDGFVRLQAFTIADITVYGSARTTATPKAIGFAYLAIGD